MKNLLIILILLVFISSSVLAKSNESIDVKNGSFMDLGRYVETLELNNSVPKNIEEEEIDDFENQAIIDVAKRYEENSVELKLDNDDDVLGVINNDRVFKLRVNETQYRIENDIKTENMIWDSSKSFSQAFINNSRHLAPMPSVINSSKITANVSKSVTASLGQSYLYNSTDNSLLFVRANESTYNTGSVITYNGGLMNLSLGSFASSYNNAASGGAIVATQPLALPKNTGSFSFGGAFMANEEQDYDKSTGGLFAQYQYKRLKLNAQVGQSKFSNSRDIDTSLYLVPELQLTDSISLKSRLIRNVTQETMQDELVLNFKPKKNNRNLEIELSATNQYTENAIIKQRIKLSTSFRI